MAWEYLEHKDYRYDIVAWWVEDFDYVVEYNSGNSRLREYVANHICNDFYDNRADFQITDEEFYKKIKKCDVLVCLGIGGHEITKEPLESATITGTLIKTANEFKPRLMILECIEKFKSIPENIIKKTGYDILDVKEANGVTWLDNRVMYICRM